MSAQTPVDKKSPLWLAWLVYRETPEYANTLRWAQVEQHAEGSLWAAFSQGFAAATGRAAPCASCGNPLDERFHNPVTGSCL